MDCESCALPMQDPEDYGASDMANKYCKYCAPDGNLKSREAIREEWIIVVMMMKDISREEAKRRVDEAMRRMPAWQV